MDDKFLKIMTEYLGGDLHIAQQPNNPLHKAFTTEFHSRDDDRVEINTLHEAFCYMYSATNATRNFLNNKKTSLISEKTTTVTSTLAEIIAYYYLSQAGFNVTPQKTNENPSADFLVNLPTGEEAIVEIACKCMCHEATERIRKANENIEKQIATAKKPGVYMGCELIRPYGYSNDSCTADAISKICSIKDDEQQMSDKIPSILWLDLGSNSDFVTIGELLYPLNSYRGCITSGHLWYGFYGKKGYNIYTNYSIDETIPQEGSVEEMQHNGRFNNITKLSGCIIRSSMSCFFYEHPSPLQPISDRFRKQLLLLPHFSIEQSVANFYPNMVNEQNKVTEQYIHALKC